MPDRHFRMRMFKNILAGQTVDVMNPRQMSALAEMVELGHLEPLGECTGPIPTEAGIAYYAEQERKKPNNGRRKPSHARRPRTRPPPKTPRRRKPPEKEANGHE